MIQCLIQYLANGNTKTLFMFSLNTPKMHLHVCIAFQWFGNIYSITVTLFYYVSDTITYTIWSLVKPDCQGYLGRLKKTYLAWLFQTPCIQHKLTTAMEFMYILLRCHPVITLYTFMLLWRYFTLDKWGFTHLRLDRTLNKTNGKQSELHFANNYLNSGGNLDSIKHWRFVRWNSVCTLLYVCRVKKT